MEYLKSSDLNLKGPKLNTNKEKTFLIFTKNNNGINISSMLYSLHFLHHSYSIHYPSFSRATAAFSILTRRFFLFQWWRWTHVSLRRYRLPSAPPPGSPFLSIQCSLRAYWSRPCTSRASQSSFSRWSSPNYRYQWTHVSVFLYSLLFLKWGSLRTMQNLIFSFQFKCRWNFLCFWSFWFICWIQFCSLLLTIPASVGYEQNPLSVYYCYDVEDSDTRLKKCIAEVYDN